VLRVALEPGGDQRSTPEPRDRELDLRVVDQLCRLADLDGATRSSVAIGMP
jgi:hypothetical protein